MRTTGTPAKVVINEAVDLAKKFSSEEASAFINGVLDAAAKSFGEKTSA
jgi:N utilization substance protein B